MPSNTSKLSINNTERVMVYIDGSNLYHVLSQNCGRHDLQFDKFSKKLADGRSLRRTYYYNVKQDNETSASMVQDQKKFLDSMYETPFLEVRLGIWKQRGDTLVEKGVDVMLATDLVAHAYQDQFDTAIKERKSKGFLSDTTFVGLNSADIKDHKQNNNMLEVTVDFVSEIIICVRDKNKNIMSGDPEKVKRVHDTWKFSKDSRSSNPNWILIDTQV